MHTYIYTCISYICIHTGVGLDVCAIISGELDSMQLQIHAYIHACIHTDHTYRSYIHTCIYIHTDHTYIHAYKYIDTHIHTHINT